MSFVSFVLFFVAITLSVCWAGECTETNCGNPPCWRCVTVSLATFWKDCGSTDNWETVPPGTAVLRYNMNTPCSGCTSDRVNSRVEWGFFAIGDLGNCQPYGLTNATRVGCPAPGDYNIVQAHTLRSQPVGIQCGLLQPGEEKFSLVKTDPSCSWCYGRASGPVCDDIGSDCPNCWGWTECTAI